MQAARPGAFARFARRRAALLGGAVAIVLSSTAAHAWAASIRTGGDIVMLVETIVWSSVWLWAGIAGVAWLGYGSALAWQTRREQGRLEARFRIHGVP